MKQLTCKHLHCTIFTLLLSKTCDVSALNDIASRPDLSNFSIDEVLPTAADYTSLMTNYTIIAAGIIQKHIPFFKKNIKRVIRHIPHSHSREMSQISEVVSVHAIYSVSLHFTFLYNRFPQEFYSKMKHHTRI